MALKNILSYTTNLYLYHGCSIGPITLQKAYYSWSVVTKASPSFIEFPFIPKNKPGFNFDSIMYRFFPWWMSFQSWWSAFYTRLYCFIYVPIFTFPLSTVRHFLLLTLVIVKAPFYSFFTTFHLWFDLAFSGNCMIFSPCLIDEPGTSRYIPE